MKKYWLYFLLIIFLALSLRIYRFDYRFFFFSDSARDALVAREAIRTKTIPQIASFSSAGPFVFGPEYYWFLMSTYIFNPNNLLMPYYFLIGLSIVFLGVMMLTSKLLLNNKFSLLTGLIIAVSPRQIFRSMSMTQHTVVAVCAAAALYFFVRFIKEKKSRQLFLCGFFVSTAISLHYQALGLLIFGLAVFFIKVKLKKRLILFLAFTIGAILPILPLFIWDYGQQFANVRNLLDYMLIGQYRIYVANRWIWHILDFWPSTVADIFGGNKIVGGIAIYGSIFLLFLSILKRKASLAMRFIFIFFIFFYIYLRYYRAEKFEGYLIYLHPFIFILISYFYYKLSALKKTAWCLMTFIFVLNFAFIKNEFKYKNENELSDLKRITQKIELKVGRDKKLAVYDFADVRGQTSTSDLSETLSLYLDSQNKLDYQKGVKIGFCKTDCPENPENEIKDKFIDRFFDYLYIIRLDNKAPLVKRSPDAVMNEVLFWWRARPLKSSFNLGKFILERIPIINKYFKTQISKLK